jgi:hypothetical protein
MRSSRLVCSLSGFATVLLLTVGCQPPAPPADAPPAPRSPDEPDPGNPNLPGDYHLPPPVMKAEEVTPSQVMTLDCRKFWAGDRRVTLLPSGRPGADDAPGLVSDQTKVQTKGNQGTITREIKFRARFKDAAPREVFDDFLTSIQAEMEAVGAKVGAREGAAPSLRAPAPGGAGDQPASEFRAMPYSIGGRSCRIQVFTGRPADAPKDGPRATNDEVTILFEELVFKHH